MQEYCVLVQTPINVASPEDSRRDEGLEPEEAGQEQGCAARDAGGAGMIREVFEDAFGLLRWGQVQPFRLDDLRALRCLFLK